MKANSIYQNRIASLQTTLSERFSNITAPSSIFQDILADRMGRSVSGVTYISGMPANLATIQGTAAESATTVTTSATMQEKRAKYEPLVKQAAAKYHINENLVHAVIRAESSYNPQAVSSAGAQGMMQLMPGTAKELGVTNSFDAAQNIDGGTKYLRSLLDRFNGDTKLALAAYNCGPNRVSSLGIASSYDAVAYTKLSDGVRSYVSRVLSYVDA